MHASERLTARKTRPPAKKEESHMTYKTKGTCSQAINVEVQDGIITSVQFVGGCAGNTAGISKLVTGMKADEVIQKLEGTTCGMRPTSCPDQLAKALKQLKAGQA